MKLRDVWASIVSALGDLDVPLKTYGSGGGGPTEIADSGTLVDDVATLQATAGTDGDFAVLLNNGTTWRWSATLARWISDISYQQGAWTAVRTATGGADPTSEGFTWGGGTGLNDIESQVTLTGFVSGASVHTVTTSSGAHTATNETDIEDALDVIKASIDTAHSVTCTRWGTSEGRLYVPDGVGGVTAGALTAVVSDGEPWIVAGSTFFAASNLVSAATGASAEGACIGCGWFRLLATSQNPGLSDTWIVMQPATTATLTADIMNDATNGVGFRPYNTSRSGTISRALRDIVVGAVYWVEWGAASGKDIEATNSAMGSWMLINGDLLGFSVNTATIGTSRQLVVGNVDNDLDIGLRNFAHGYI